MALNQSICLAFLFFIPYVYFYCWSCLKIRQFTQRFFSITHNVVSTQYLASCSVRSHIIIFKRLLWWSWGSIEHIPNSCMCWQFVVWLDPAIKVKYRIMEETFKFQDFWADLSPLSRSGFCVKEDCPHGNIGQKFSFVFVGRKTDCVTYIHQQSFSFLLGFFSFPFFFGWISLLVACWCKFYI